MAPADLSGGRYQPWVTLGQPRVSELAVRVSEGARLVGLLATNLANKVVGDLWDTLWFGGWGGRPPPRRGLPSIGPRKG